MFIHYPIAWCFYKQRTKSYFSYGAKIFATRTVEDGEGYNRFAFSIVFAKRLLRHDLNVDLKAIWDAVTTLQKENEY